MFFQLDFIAWHWHYKRIDMTSEQLFVFQMYLTYIAGVPLKKSSSHKPVTTITFNIEHVVGNSIDFNKGVNTKTNTNIE